MHILVAEDDKNLGHLLTTELERNGYGVTLAEDGVAAVLAFIDNRFDFVLLDIRMPKLDGIDTLRIIRKLNPQVPSITFSGSAGIEEVEESVRAGALKCLRKPFGMAQIIGEIREHAHS